MSVARTPKLDKRYAELIHEFPLRPIRNDRDLGRAMKFAGGLAVYDEGTLSRGEQDYLDTLTVLIEEYDRKHNDALPDATPLEMLKHLMEEHEISISGLGRLIGSQPNASLIFSGKRDISKRVIQILSRHFNVEPGVFIEGPTIEPVAFNPIGSGPMKVELNDRECYIAATALHVRSMQLEKGIADEPTMEDRHWKLDLIARCRKSMRKVDEAWRKLYDKSRPGEIEIKGFAKGEWTNRKTVVDLPKSELQDVISVLEGKIGEISAREVRALAKKLENLLQDQGE